jgi:eukaryotic-like serine/threonine-protein kinase
VFGRYLLLQRLSRGGMGEIFLAKHGLAGFEKLAVIKKVLPHLAEDAQFISRFVDEAQVAIKLAHVNIAQVFEVGRVGDEYFLGLEYVEGRDLRRTLSLLAQEKRRFPIDIALLIGREIANGLAYAHRRTAADGSSLGLVHCDISPPNIMVSFEGETKIIDFGIARSALRGTTTDPKMGFGKFGYMAPEQLLRGGVVDHRTDVYAAGVVLFELLTGHRLYDAKDFADYRALARAVAQGQHRVPSDLDPELALCDSLITTALAPRPEDRFATAADLRDAIQRVLAAVNPTVSTDHLSAVMRGLFAAELAQQSELQERIANTHLADFHEQLHTQAVPTVSFALSEPVAPVSPAPPVMGSGAERARRPGSASAAAAMPARPATHPAPPPAASPALLPAAARDRGDSLTFTRPGPGRAPRSTLMVVSVSAAIVVGAAVFVVLRTLVARPPAAKVVPTVQPIDERPAALAPRPAAPLPAAGVTPAPVASPGPAAPAAPPRKRPERDAAMTRELVRSQFQSVIAEYGAFKAEYGLRLEQEWGNLATFMQFELRSDNVAEAVRKIDAFRARMRAATHK